MRTRTSAPSGHASSSCVALNRDRSSDGVLRPAEGEEESLALSVHLPSAVLLECVSHELPVPREQTGVAGSKPLEKASRALDVRKNEGDRANGQFAHGSAYRRTRRGTLHAVRQGYLLVARRDAVRRGVGAPALARGGRSAGRDPGHGRPARAPARGHGRPPHGRRGASRTRRRQVEVVETNRGGKSTYHAPGQLVCYPILDLNRHGRDVKRYVRDLEEAVIRTLAAHAIEGERIEGLTGVWLSAPPRKICSIGVHVSRWVTTHGYALNVDLDPAPFTDWITACGLEDAAFTTMARELGRPIAVDDVRPAAVRRARRGLRPRAGGAAGGGRRGTLGAAHPREDRRMSRGIQPIPRPGWDPLPDSRACVGPSCSSASGASSSRAALLGARVDSTSIAGDNDTIVTCIQGEGFTSVARRRCRFGRKQQVRWPKGIPHRLWTEGSTMTTLMFERLG